MNALLYLRDLGSPSLAQAAWALLPQAGRVAALRAFLRPSRLAAEELCPFLDAAAEPLASLPPAVGRSLRADPARALSAVLRGLAERDLHAFVRLFWPLVEPAPFRDGWALRALCRHLEAVRDGRIRRLAIVLPPGAAKSLLLAVFFPAWVWTAAPETRFLFSSYKESLALRDARRMRRLVSSDLYRSNWPIALLGDASAMQRFENDRGGVRLTTSVGGSVTGERGDVVVLDDPLAVGAAESERERTDALRYFVEELPTRINDPETSRLLVAGHRVHCDDVLGAALASPSWERIVLPMVADGRDRCRTSLGFRDGRAEGELLWPELYSAEYVEAKREELGPYAWAGQFQADPVPRGEGMFRRDWFSVVDVVPPGGLAVRAWDLGASRGGDWTVGAKMRRVGSRYYVEHVLRMRGTPHEVESVVKATAAADGRAVRISLPEDPGAAGKFAASYLVGQLAGYTVRTSRESGSKEERAAPLASQAQAGNILLLRGAWNEDALRELETFPVGPHDDIVDALARAFAELVGSWGEPSIPCAPYIADYDRPSWLAGPGGYRSD